MSSPSPFDVADCDGGAKSRFTYRDLRLLSQSSITSPLRVIALVDFDCFYCQCEAVRLGLPDDQPLGVQQFNHVIAMNYPARAMGLKKVVTAVEAKQKCPNIVLQHVPTWREGDTTWAYRDDALEFMDTDKSSLDYYRLQSRKAFDIVKNTLPMEPPQKVEKAGIDEMFLDLSAQVHGILLQRYPELVLPSDESLDAALPTPPTENLDWSDDQVYGTGEPEEDTRTPDWNDVALSVGAEIARNLRMEIHKQLKYTCSAGVARNKVLAKLAAGHNKPNKQTIVRDSCITSFLSSYKLTKLRGLGGKLGAKAVQKFGTDSMAELLPISQSKMQAELGSESGLWLFRIIRGIEYSEVVSRTQIKSMASAKTFNPTIAGPVQAERWLQIFAADIMGRIDELEGRRPRTIAVHVQPNGRFGPSQSKQAPIPLGSKVDTPLLLSLSRNVLTDIAREAQCWPCRTLSVGVSDFFDTDTTSQSITSYWAPQKHPVIAESTKHSSPDIADEAKAVIPAKTGKRTLLDYQTESSPRPPTNGTRRNEASKRQRDLEPKGFFTHRSRDINTQPGSTESKYHCPTCQKHISSDGVLEHLDWHVAFDLQNQG